MSFYETMSLIFMGMIAISLRQEFNNSICNFYWYISNLLEPFKIGEIIESKEPNYDLKKEYYLITGISNHSYIVKELDDNGNEVVKKHISSRFPSIEFDTIEKVYAKKSYKLAPLTKTKKEIKDLLNE